MAWPNSLTAPLVACRNRTMETQGAATQTFDLLGLAGRLEGIVP